MSCVLSENKKWMGLFDDAKESQKAAKKALGVYIRRLENAYNNQMVRDPVRPKLWISGVAQATWFDNDLSRLFL